MEIEQSSMSLFEDGFDISTFLKGEPIEPTDSYFGAKDVAERDMLLLSSPINSSSSEYDSPVSSDDYTGNLLKELIDSTTKLPRDIDSMTGDTLEFPTNSVGQKKKGRKRKKEILSPEEQRERENRRKQQTQVASKLYRQRKKQMEETMAQKLERLEDEKRLLAQEMQASKELIQKLKEENTKLKQNNLKESAELAKRRLEVLRKLERQLAEGATEEAIMETVNEGRKICDRCIGLGRRELMELIKPSVVENLASKGLLLTEKFMVETRDRRGGIADIVDQIKEELHDITEEQIRTMTEVEQRHYQELDVLHKERAELLVQLSKYFTGEKLRKSKGPLVPLPMITEGANLASAGKLELLDLVGAAGLLEHLRQSLNSEALQWNKSVDIILDRILKPRQIAQFYLFCEFQHAAIQQLSIFWSALNKDWAQNSRSWA